MRTLRIYPIIILTILVISIFLPTLYKNIFGTRVDKTMVFYSPVDEDFIKMTRLKGKDRKVIYSNFQDETYSLDEHKIKLPFIFYSDLLKIDKFPEKFSSYAQDIMSIRREKSYMKIKPEMIKTKVVNLYPLFESKPKYSSLELPKDLFSLTKEGIQFVTTSTNKINTKKSNVYNNRLKELGAKFPLYDAFGTPTTRKPFDEGYFILDSTSQLFHLKQIDNKPSIKKVPTKDFETKFVLNKENSRKEFYGLLISKTNDVYLMMYDDYELVKLPVENFDYNKKSIKLMTTPINRIITIEHIDKRKKEKNITTIVTNLDYEVIKKNNYTYSLKKGAVYENIKKWIFPFKVYLVKNPNGDYSFQIRDLNENAFTFTLILSLVFLIYLKVKGYSIRKHFLQVVLIATSGIFALIALILFKKLFIETNINKGQK